MKHRRREGARSQAAGPWTARVAADVSAWVAREAWRPERLHARGLAGFAYRNVRIAWLAGRGLLRDQCALRSAALTYVTVLSLVPLLALSFSVAKGFGFYRDLLEGTINPFLDSAFGPVSRAAEGAATMRDALARVLEFVERTNVGALGALGLVFLILTALKLLTAIEATFNSIWGAERQRSLLRKVSDYLSMLVVTPLLLFAATGFTALAQSSSVVAFLRDEAHLGVAIDGLVRIVPLLAVWAGFTFLYSAMPNARTRFSSALLGGLFAGVGWQVALVLHIRFQVGVANYNAIYSSFAAIPLFLVWVNLSWLIVLFGAELCFAHQSEPSYLEAPGQRTDDRGVLEVVGLRAATRIASGFLLGDPPVSAAKLATRLLLPEPSVVRALERLAAAGIVAPVEGEEEERWVLARDPGAIRAKEVVDALGAGGNLARIPVRGALDEAAERVLRGLEADLQASPHNRTLRDLAESAHREEEGAARGPAPAAREGGRA